MISPRADDKSDDANASRIHFDFIRGQPEMQITSNAPQRKLYSLLEEGSQAIDSLVDTKPSWAGREIDPPTARAVETAQRAYRLLLAGELIPDRIVASGEGGVAFCFLEGEAYADLEFLNSGEHLASTESRGQDSDSRRIWEFTTNELPTVIASIKEFLSQHGSRAV